MNAKSLQSCLTVFDPVDCSLSGFSDMGFSRQEYWSKLPCPPPRDLPNLGTEPRAPSLQEDSLPSVPPGKPKNTGMGGLSLLQGIFLIQAWNQYLAALQADSLPAELPGKPMSRTSLY